MAFYTVTEKTTDVWLTPHHIINVLGEFDLDPCSHPTPPFRIATNTYSIEHGQDGLLLDWQGRVWLNPPYSEWAKWVKRLKDHGNGIALIFARTDTRAFFDHVWGGRSCSMFPQGTCQVFKT